MEKKENKVEEVVKSEEEIIKKDKKKKDIAKKEDNVMEKENNKKEVAVDSNKKSNLESKNNNIKKEEQEKVMNIIKRAKENGKITYGELANELEDTNPEQLDKIFDTFEDLGVDIKEEPSLAVLSNGEELEELKACQTRIGNIEEMFKKVNYSSNKHVVQKVEVKNPIIMQKESKSLKKEQEKGSERDF